MGRGFLAGHLEPIAQRHPQTVALAAGVSWGSATSAADFAREATLVAETARRCRVSGRRLLFFSTSSAAIYGLADGPGREDRPVRPANPYGVHKLRLERLVRSSGARHLVLRLSHLVGPNQPAHQLLPTLTRLIHGGRVTVHRGANRDLIDVADVVRIIDLLLGRDVSDGIVNVASGTSVPVEAIVDRLEQRLGITAERVYLDGGSAHAVCVDKLRSLVPETASFGFGPTYFRGAVDAFVRWELSHA